MPQKKNSELLTNKRCRNHPLREAVATCPECRNDFCRECITEHDDRVLCSSCIKDLLDKQSSKNNHKKRIPAFFHLIIGFFVIWLVFYAVGRILLLIPSSFHEGTLWKGQGWDFK